MRDFFHNFLDALTRQRTDGALVRLITPVYPGEEVEGADRRLTAFTQAIVPVLDEFYRSEIIFTARCARDAEDAEKCK